MRHGWWGHHNCDTIDQLPLFLVGPHGAKRPEFLDRHTLRLALWGAGHVTLLPVPCDVYLETSGVVANHWTNPIEICSNI
jgi:hypothetical protein